MNRFLATGAIALSLVISPFAASAATSVLWFDATNAWGGQAAPHVRKKMSDYLNAYEGGTAFSSTFYGNFESEAPPAQGSLAELLAHHTFDVIVIDSTTDENVFNAADLDALKAFYATGKSNLLLDGAMYPRSIGYDIGTDFPGVNGATGAFVINEISALAARGGGLLIGTDNDTWQASANAVLGALIPQAAFDGAPQAFGDGAFAGSELHAGPASLATRDLLYPFVSGNTLGRAPTGAYTDFLGQAVTLHSQLDMAASVGGARETIIATSFAAQGDSAYVIAPVGPPPKVQPAGVVPEPTTWALLIAGYFGLGSAIRRSRRAGPLSQFA